MAREMRGVKRIEHHKRVAQSISSISNKCARSSNIAQMPQKAASSSARHIARWHKMETEIVISARINISL